MPARPSRTSNTSEPPPSDICSSLDSPAARSPVPAPSWLALATMLHRQAWQRVLARPAPSSAQLLSLRWALQQHLAFSPSPQARGVEGAASGAARIFDRQCQRVAAGHCRMTLMLARALMSGVGCRNAGS